MSLPNSAATGNAKGKKCALRARIHELDDEAALRKLEDEIEAALNGQLAKPPGDEESGSETMAAIALAQRLDNLIHHRRAALSAPKG